MDVKEKILPSRKSPPCRKVHSESEEYNIGKTPRYYDALPRDCKYAYMTPGYYATGFRILDVYKTEVDFSEYRNLTFIVDPDKVKKWGYLRSRIPYPEGRITDLPGTSNDRLEFNVEVGVARKIVSTDTNIYVEQNRIMPWQIRDLNYKNYCLRSLTPESAKSWRNSIQKFPEKSPDNEEENEVSKECVCPD